jgi:hypothetical protein
MTKEQIITELYKSGQLQEKLVGIMYRHKIPMNADLQNDIIQTTFLNLTEYDTNKLIEAYENNPKRILALAVTIMLRKCILKDKRYGNNKHSLLTSLLYSSSLNTNNIPITPTDDYDENFYMHSVIQEEEEMEMTDYYELWEYLKTKLNKEDKLLINKLFNKQKILLKDKKILYKKIKNIIEQR